MALLAQAHILSGPVLDTPGFLDDAQVHAREFIQPVTQPGVGTIGIPKAPFHFSDAKVEIRRRAPLLGEHNEEVLSTLLEYDKKKIEELSAAGVLQRDSRVDELRTSGEL